jgi:hypothetical protein
MCTYTNVNLNEGATDALAPDCQVGRQACAFSDWKQVYGTLHLALFLSLYNK